MPNKLIHILLFALHTTSLFAQERKFRDPAIYVETGVNSTLFNKRYRDYLSSENISLATTPQYRVGIGCSYELYALFDIKVVYSSSHCTYSAPQYHKSYLSKHLSYQAVALVPCCKKEKFTPQNNIPLLGFGCGITRNLGIKKYDDLPFDYRKRFFTHIYEFRYLFKNDISINAGFNQDITNTAKNTHQTKVKEHSYYLTIGYRIKVK